MWGPNLCNAVSGRVSSEKRMGTRRASDMHTHPSDMHTRPSFLPLSLLRVSLVTHTCTHACCKAEHGSRQINGFSPEEFSITALEPWEHEQMTIKSIRQDSWNSYQTPLLPLKFISGQVDGACDGGLRGSSPSQTPDLSSSSGSKPLPWIWHRQWNNTEYEGWVSCCSPPPFHLRRLMMCSGGRWSNKLQRIKTRTHNYFFSTMWKFRL